MTGEYRHGIRRNKGTTLRLAAGAENPVGPYPSVGRDICQSDQHKFQGLGGLCPNSTKDENIPPLPGLHTHSIQYQSNSLPMRPWIGFRHFQAGSHTSTLPPEPWGMQRAKASGIRTSRCL